MALRCVEKTWTKSIHGPYLYRGPLLDPDTGEVLEPADIPGVTSPLILDEEIEWTDGELDENGQPVMEELRNVYTGQMIVKQRQVTKKGTRIERLKELGLFEEIGGEREPDSPTTTAEDRILAELEQRTGFSDEELFKAYRDAGIRSVRNKIELLEALIKG